MKISSLASCLAVGSALLLGACGGHPGPATAALDSSSPILPESYKQVETGSAVMPPGINSSCPNGRMLVTYGRQYGAQRMASKDLACYLNGTAGCFAEQPPSELSGDNITFTSSREWTGSGQPQNFSCKPNQEPTQSIPRDNIWYTDSLMTRVATSDLLHIYLVMANHPPKTPVPNRLDKTKPIGCNNPFTTCSLAIVRSTDCAGNWVKKTVIDLNDPNFMGGAWAVPEWDAQGITGQGSYAIDRPEVWVDPWFPFPVKSAIFLTAAIRLGPKAGKSMVLKSFDGGDDWMPAVLLPGQNANNSGNPTVITTTTNHRVYAFRCEGTEPKLYWSDDYGNTFPDKNSLTFKYQDQTLAKPLDCGQVASTNLQDSVGAGSPSVGITRWGASDLDDVLIMYSGVVNNQEVAAVMMLLTRVAGDKNPSVNSELLIKGDSGHSILQATFVPTDRFEFHPDENNDPLYDGTLVYWMDVPAKGASTANYMTVRRGLLWSDKKALAVKNGAADTWSWNVDSTNPFIGDYNRGSFIYADLSGKNQKPQLHFFSTWEQSNPGDTTNVLIHSNMVNWSEP
jgi:hypothetical protein